MALCLVVGEERMLQGKDGYTDELVSENIPIHQVIMDAVSIGTGGEGRERGQIKVVTSGLMCDETKELLGLRQRQGVRCSRGVWDVCLTERGLCEERAQTGHPSTTQSLKRVKDCGGCYRRVYSGDHTQTPFEQPKSTT